MPVVPDTISPEQNTYFVIPESLNRANNVIWFALLLFVHIAVVVVIVESVNPPNSSDMFVVAPPSAQQFDHASNVSDEQQFVVAVGVVMVWRHKMFSDAHWTISDGATHIVVVPNV